MRFIASRTNRSNEPENSDALFDAIQRLRIEFEKKYHRALTSEEKRILDLAEQLLQRKVPSAASE